MQNKSIIIKGKVEFNMKTVLKIYNRDFKNIISNWVALVVTIALVILPSLYAWFNIKSAWDPYGNTKGILVAVVNRDKGGSYRDKTINVGNELVEKLKSNTSMGWKFVDEKEAEHGVKYGKYYASITIPENFSDSILSITKDNPHKADIIYSVNEKINAVAPKITQKGVTSIQQQVTTTFIETVNGLIFDIFNRLGIELEKGKPQLKTLMEMIFEVDRRIPEINKAVNDVYDGAIVLQGLLNRIQNDLPLIDDTIKKTTDIVTKGQSFLTKSQDTLRNLSPFIKQELIVLRNISSTTETLINQALNLIESDPVKAREAFVKAKGTNTQAINKIDNLLELINSLGNNSSNKTIVSLTNSLKAHKIKLQSISTDIDSVIKAIDNKDQDAASLLNKLKQDSTAIGSFLDNIINNYDSTIAPEVDNILSNSITAASNTLKLLQDANNNLPAASDLIQKANKGTNTGIADIIELKKNLPSIESSIHSTAEKLRALDNDASLNEVIRLLKLDARKEADFIANPVNVVQNRLFPIPNYGSGMAPFFTTLSLWVGALILVSILSVDVHKPLEGVSMTLQEAYLGRYLTFLTIALLQALAVTLGDIYLLKVYVSNIPVFIVYAMYISLIFSMIVYTLVSVFGNVGKALSMILLVLQISASGGTFPIEVTPAFFQHLNPFLPFTYAIAGMREAVGGVLWDVLITNGLILEIYFVVFIVIGLAWKSLFRGLIVRFVAKFKDSGLMEEE